MLYTGIDLHKRSIVLTTLAADGSLVQRGKLPTDPHRVADYFSALGESAQIATVEATGSWYWLADLLRSGGIDLRLAHAKYLKAIAYAKVKTDAVDSATLAQLLRADLIPAAHMISPDRRPLRDLLRTRAQLVEKRVSAKNSIERLFEKYNVAAVEALPTSAQFQARLHQEQIELLQRQVRALEKQLRKALLADADVQRLLWVPGIGTLAALTIVLETDGIGRFPSDRHFFSYCRLVPGSHNSAEKTRHRRSKDGNRYLKQAFSTAALRAIQYFPEIRSFAIKQARRSNKHVARAIVAKEIARICYYMLRDQSAFNGRFKGVELSRTKSAEWPRRSSPDA